MPTSPGVGAGIHKAPRWCRGFRWRIYAAKALISALSHSMWLKLAGAEFQAVASRAQAQHRISISPDHEIRPAAQHPEGQAFLNAARTNA